MHRSCRSHNCLQQNQHQQLKNNKKVYFSNHAIDRFKERFLYQYQINENTTILSFLIDLFSKSSRNLSFINNTKFMLDIGEKHGYENLEIYCIDELVFLVRENIVVTIMHNQWVPIKINKKYNKPNNRNDIDIDENDIDPKLEKLSMSGYFKNN